MLKQNKTPQMFFLNILGGGINPVISFGLFITDNASIISQRQVTV